MAKKSFSVLTLSFIVIMCSCETKESSQGNAFLNNVNQTKDTIQNDSHLLTFFKNPRRPITPAFQQLPSGSNKPEGWLLDVMKEDLEHGLVGALDELYPGIKKDDLYNTARRGGLEDVPEMGDLVLTGAAWEASIMWWNAETIGNWWDGFVRHAYLTNDEASIKQSEAIVENLLASQDEDGYIGIYKENLRYQHTGSNGELWAQTTAFRMLLAYYEFTNDERVLDSVERAMAVTMAEYGEESKNPFDLENAFGGVTHGLMMTDVCETLFRITGNQEYQDYAVYLYKAFSSFSINRSFNDLRYPYLMERDSAFTGHAVHTYEHFRTLINAYYATGYDELKEAYDNALFKLDPLLLPSGAAHGNEWILGLEADPTVTSTEFCAMFELRNFFGSAFQKTGDISYADRAERLTFNAMLGARNENGTAMTYGKPDNAYVLDGHHHGEGEPSEDTRYKYSPTHSEPAVCCSPNYARNLGYYLDYMWMKTDDGLAALMYGPSILTSSIKGADVEIKQETNYPFSDEIRFTISVSEPTEFTLLLRKPGWSKSVELAVDGASVTESEDYLRVTKQWEGSEVMTLSFENEIEVKNFDSDDMYVQRGPLVYSYPIPSRQETIKNYEGSEFTDYYVFPTSESFYSRSLSPTFEFRESVSDSYPHYSGVLPVAPLITVNPGTEEPFQLVPMGATILRRVTFEGE
ncbi:MAG: hypothetical protein ED557_06240 [Balneola sp.]|nr:MAG: hypothetical protein ED557_06240 [Balneola sp.]